ncbi:MAG: molybdopterin molybdotransferase MoeA [Mucilaginibacter sp.]
MTKVEEAEKLILAEAKDFGTEIISFDQSIGRVLAENITADRDLPPFNRVMMDGIAINYRAIEKGISSFRIKGIQAAGEEPIETTAIEECVEIMTGAALPASTDTIIRYEDVAIKDGLATVLVNGIQRHQSVHLQGADKKQDQVIISKGQLITPSLINTIASVGKSEVQVKKLPTIVVISSGDELVDIKVMPSPIQIRKSNSYTIQAILHQHDIKADLLHIPDDATISREKIGYCLKNYDVILMTGGISMGKFDYIPCALEDIGVKTIFHKVSQRPGKPFWFGKHDNGILVFAFPGNPVATFMCMHRYFLPWLSVSQDLNLKAPMYALLSEDFYFTPELTYFLQVKLSYSPDGRIIAQPIEGNGSGDFANLADTDAFMELPSEQNEFKQGQAYRIWLFN